MCCLFHAQMLHDLTLRLPLPVFCISGVLGPAVIAAEKAEVGAAVDEIACTETTKGIYKSTFYRLTPGVVSTTPQTSMRLFSVRREASGVNGHSLAATSSDPMFSFSSQGTTRTMPLTATQEGAGVFEIS
jgi:hypothetical protein